MLHNFHVINKMQQDDKGVAVVDNPTLCLLLFSSEEVRGRLFLAINSILHYSLQQRHSRPRPIIIIYWSTIFRDFPFPERRMARALI